MAVIEVTFLRLTAHRLRLCYQQLARSWPEIEPHLHFGHWNWESIQSRCCSLNQRVRPFLVFIERQFALKLLADCSVMALEHLISVWRTVSAGTGFIDNIWCIQLIMCLTCFLSYSTSASGQEASSHALDKKNDNKSQDDWMHCCITFIATMAVLCSVMSAWLVSFTPSLLSIPCQLSLACNKAKSFSTLFVWYFVVKMTVTWTANVSVVYHRRWLRLG